MEVVIFFGIYSVKVKLYSQRVLLVTASTDTTEMIETETGRHTDRPSPLSQFPNFATRRFPLYQGYNFFTAFELRTILAKIWVSGQLAGTCECGNELLDSIICGGLLEELKNLQLLKQDSAPWSK